MAGRLRSIRPGVGRGFFFRGRGRGPLPLRAAKIGVDRIGGGGWIKDGSNADETFTRNRIRHSVLPVLRAENPAIDQALANLAELAREDETRWQVELGRILPQMLLPGKPVRGGGRAAGGTSGESVAIEIDRLRALDPALRRRVLRAAARTLGARLSFDETARLLALTGLAGSDAPVGSARGGGTLQLSGGLRAQRSAREIRLFREPSTKKPATN